jgi:hypothetical protein
MSHTHHPDLFNSGSNAIQSIILKQGSIIEDEPFEPLWETRGRSTDSSTHDLRNKVLQKVYAT